MRFSITEPEMIIKLGSFLLYVLLFISLTVVYGHFDKPFTFPFLGAIFALVIPVLFLLKDEEEDKLQFQTPVFWPVFCHTAIGKQHEDKAEFQQKLAHFI